MPPPQLRGADPTAPAVVVEPAGRRVRAVVGGATVADSEAALMLFERGSTPRWYFPVGDVRMDLLVPSAHRTESSARGPARWWDVRRGDGLVPEAAWAHDAPPPGCPDLRSYVGLVFDAFDHWFEEDTEVFVHPRDPYKRVDVLDSSRHVVVEVGGEVVAESRRPKLLLETGLPVRYYLPLADVRLDLLEASDTATSCPYKGDASYWHLTVGGRRLHDVVWGYRFPLPEVRGIAGHACFFQEFVDLRVDGEVLERPETKWRYQGPGAWTSRPGDEPWDPAVRVGPPPIDPRTSD